MRDVRDAPRPLADRGILRISWGWRILGTERLVSRISPPACVILAHAAMPQELRDGRGALRNRWSYPPFRGTDGIHPVLHHAYDIESGIETVERM